MNGQAHECVLEFYLFDETDNSNISLQSGRDMVNPIGDVNNYDM